MKILVLGGTGHIGKRLVETLKATSWATPVIASREPSRAIVGQLESVRVDTCDIATMTTALKGCDAVVNCVAGDAHSISEGAQTLVQAALAAQCPRIVHLSTMAVYGPAEGVVFENAPLDPSLGWYGQAKCEAETHLGEFVRRGGQAVLLRPGCVFGPGSELWVGRVGRWLQTGRLGDLGVAGDGWSNLVHVDDVCQALVAALRLPSVQGELPVFNLAAPDSPRWNDYFVDLALQIQATPVRRIGARQLRLDAFVLSPPLKALQLVLRRLGQPHSGVPHALPPGLLRLWAQHIHLNAALATRQLGVVWTPYRAGLQSSVDWFCEAGAARAHLPEKTKATCTP